MRIADTDTIPVVIHYTDDGRCLCYRVDDVASARYPRMHAALWIYSLSVAASGVPLALAADYSFTHSRAAN